MNMCTKCPSPARMQAANVDTTHKQQAQQPAFDKVRTNFDVPPVLTPMEPHSATDVGEPDDLLTAASSLSRPASESTKLATPRRKTTATAAAPSGSDACPMKASKSRSQCGAVTTSQTPSESSAKQRWNALVRKSAPLTWSCDDIGVCGGGGVDGGVAETDANGTQSRENETPATLAHSTPVSRTTDSLVKNAAASSLPSTSSSSVSQQSRLGVGSSRKTEADARSCDHGCTCCSPSPSSSLSSTSSNSSPSSTKRRRLHADRFTATTTTECGRCCDSCRFDCRHSRCNRCHLRLRHVHRSRRCCSSCRHERRRCCDDDGQRWSRYAAAESSYWQPARQSSNDRPLVDAMSSAERCLFQRYACFNTTSSIQQTPNCHSYSAGLDGAPYIKQEYVPTDLFDAATTVDDRSAHPPSVKTSSSSENHSNDAADDARSSPTDSDRSILTRPEICPIPLEPVGAAPLSTDPRKPQQREKLTTICADVNELRTTPETSTDKVDVPVGVMRLMPVSGIPSKISSSDGLRVEQDSEPPVERYYQSRTQLASERNCSSDIAQAQQQFEKAGGWLAADVADAVLGGNQLSVLCDHVELAAATTLTACRLQQQHGLAVRSDVIDASNSALRSLRYLSFVLQADSGYTSLPSVITKTLQILIRWLESAVCLVLFKSRHNEFSHMRKTTFADVVQAPGAGNDTAQVDVTTSSRQSTTNSSRNGGGAGARDSWHAMTSLPTSYVEHTQNIVRSYERWNDALLLLDASRDCRRLLEAVTCRVPTFGDDAVDVANYVSSAVAVVRQHNHLHRHHHHRHSSTLFYQMP